MKIQSLTKEFTENEWKKKPVKEMTNEEWEYYINKCNVPQHYQPIVKKYRKNFGQHIKEIGKIPGTEFEVIIEQVADSKKGKWRNPQFIHKTEIG